MDDLMNKVGAVVEEHIARKYEGMLQRLGEHSEERNELRKVLAAGSCEPLLHAAKRVVSERAHLRDQPSKDEIRRGARALGFWEKLCEYLWDGITDDATFDEVMAKMEKLKEAARVQAQHSDLVSSTLETVRDILGAPPGAEFVTDATQRVVKERDELKEERDKLRQEARRAFAECDGMRQNRDKYRTMWEQLHRAQGEDLDAKAQLEVACAKVRELDAKLLEVRKAVGEKVRVNVGDTVRCGYFTGVVIGFRENDGAVVVKHTNDRGSETRFIQPRDITAP